jgi:hypothetical protein
MARRPAEKSTFVSNATGRPPLHVRETPPAPRSRRSTGTAKIVAAIAVIAPRNSGAVCCGHHPAKIALRRSCLACNVGHDDRDPPGAVTRSRRAIGPEKRPWRPRRGRAAECVKFTRHPAVTVNVPQRWQRRMRAGEAQRTPAAGAWPGAGTPAAPRPLHAGLGSCARGCAEVVHPPGVRTTRRDDLKLDERGPVRHNLCE